MNNDNSNAINGEKKGFGDSAFLSPLAVIALSFGYAVGWGSFVLPGTMFLPNAGPAGTIIGFLIGTVAIVVLAFNFHKLTASMQSSGGTYGFVTKVFGRNHGFLMGWFLFLTYIAILWANATALVLLARFLFGDALQFGFHYTMVDSTCISAKSCCVSPRSCSAVAHAFSANGSRSGSTPFSPLCLSRAS